MSVLFLTSCVKKQIKKDSQLNSDVVWQYSNYLNGENFPNEKELNKSDFFVLKTVGSSGFPMISYPIVGSDYIISMDRKGVVTRFNSASKKAEWKSDVIGKRSSFFGDYLNGGLSQNGTKIYATYGINFVNCIDAKTGKSLWSKNLQEMVRAYPIVHDKIVFLKTINDGMYALNSDNGEVIWYKAGLTEDVSVINVTSPIPYENVLITQDSSGRISAINIRTGFEAWIIDNSNALMFDMNLDSKEALIYQPVRINDSLYFYSSNGYFYKLNLSTRAIVWKSKVASNRQFYISNELLTVLDEENNLVGINASNGLQLWRVKLFDCLSNKDKKASARYWNAPIIVGHNVYVLSSKGEFLAFDLNGKLIKVTHEIGQNAYIPPIYTKAKTFVIS
ncbi:PQQ-binding-like beta-propeller repeat protein [Candidatus Bandiella euplotis]|uniref:PQQ-binding-like beta-propeller repeat protein n=1 Tax=Candidatus Bandiella euplotis TaxID=1664265 RepID=UPI002B263F97|nr:PQQ-binding-like beta-propeller repeat protein [Candidatus Bandiella woodruffii]